MWYIKYYADHPVEMQVETKDALSNEFRKPKSNWHPMVGCKEIVMIVNEIPWELDQRLKCVIREANLQCIDGQHYEWFIASLLPHLRIALSK